jgi:glycosyltransferase involved in cell wall biosynthesis
MTLLSIVTPVLNAARTLRQTLESVASQELHDVEHLLQDGGSTDGSLAIAAEFAHVRVVSEPDDGLYDAMNRGVRRACGEFVAILNADDLYRANAFRAVSEALRQHPTWDGLFGDVIYIDGEGRELLRRREARFDYDALRFGLCYVVHPTFFLRRTRMLELGGFQAERFPLCSDYDLFLRVAQAGWPIGHVAEFLAEFRFHDFGRSADRGIQRRMDVEATALRRQGQLELLFRAYGKGRRQLQKLVFRRTMDWIPGKPALRRVMRDKTLYSSNDVRR